MPNARDVAQALYAAWRLMRLDARGFAWFDLSAEGFWRSFFAAALVAPAYVVIVAIEFSQRPVDSSALWVGFVLIVGYALEWIVWPLAAIPITRLLGLSANYVALIVATNWINVPQSLLVAGAGALDQWAGLAAVMGPFLSLAATLYVLIYQWFVTRVALESPGLTAAGVVVLQVLITDLVHLGALSLL